MSKVRVTDFRQLCGRLVRGGLAALVALSLWIPGKAGDGSSALAQGTDDGGGWGGATEVRRSGPDAVVKPGAGQRSRARREPGVAGRAPPRAAATEKRAPATGNAVLGLDVSGDDRLTRITIGLAGPVEANASSLADPPRVIIDLPEADFRLPQGAEQINHGLVAGLRYGLFEAGRSRIVLDTRAAVKVARAEVGIAESQGAFQLEIELVPTSAAELKAVEMAEAAQALKPAVMEIEGAPRAGPAAGPVIVIDAGHGGIDPGARGKLSAEKDLVLAVAREIEKALQAAGGYEVVMTRTRDVFVSLDHRVQLARRLNAELFISVHADSIDGRDARSVRGATVYTLAEQASDDLARRMADKENAVDLLAGLPMTSLDGDDVRDFLMDLMRRESHSFANAFRDALLAELKPRVLLSHDPARAGPFKVLRQPGSPAVLVELGYISNAEDEAMMLKPEWQAKVAAAVTRAVIGHFKQRTVAKR